jgi:hypothetical protein
VVRERSAKPLCVGSIPTRASSIVSQLRLLWLDSENRPVVGTVVATCIHSRDAPETCWALSCRKAGSFLRTRGGSRWETGEGYDTSHDRTPTIIPPMSRSRQERLSANTSAGANGKARPSPEPLPEPLREGGRVLAPAASNGAGETLCKRFL